METPLFYWKKEKKQDHWKPRRDKPGARERAIKQGAMFFTWTEFSGPYTNSGAPEPMRYGDGPLDFDDAENPENSLKDLRELCLLRLPEEYGIDAYEIEYYLSGAKGFHAVIPRKCLGSVDGDTHLPLIYKKMVAQWAASYNLKTLDHSLYNMRRGKMFRIPNVKRDNGKHKVPLTLEEVRDLSYSELLALGDAPRTIDKAVDDADLEPVEDLADFYKEKQAEVHKEIKEQATAPTVKLSKNDIKHLSKNVPQCIKHIISAMPPKSEKVNFNRLVMNLVKYFQTAGFDEQKALGAVSDFLKKYPSSDTYDLPEKRFQHWRELWFYLHGQDAPFQCSYIKGLGLPGSAFECARCLDGEEISPQAQQLKEEIEKRIIAALGIDDKDEETISSLAVDVQVIDRMIKGAFWSGQKSKLFLSNHEGNLNQFTGKEAYGFLAKTFGQVVDTSMFSELVEGMGIKNGNEAEKIIKHIEKNHQEIILNYLKYQNQRDAVEYRVDMFAEQNRMEFREDIVRLILLHKPFQSHGTYDETIIEDFKDHFSRFDELLEFIVMSRFVLDRKKSYLWLKASSDWGKGFILGIFKVMGCSVETSMKEVEAMLEGKPSGRSPRDFKRAFVFVIDEFKTVKSELKQLQSEITLSPKNQLACNVEIFAKLFLSAESVGSLVTENGIEDQFANRMSLFEEEGSLVTRPLYIKVGNPAYFQSVLAYTVERINTHVDKMKARGRMKAQTDAETWLNVFIGCYGLDTYYERFSASLPKLAEEISEWWSQEWHDDRIKTTKLGCFVMSTGKMLEDYFERHFDRSQIPSLRKKKHELLKLISIDGKGVMTHRIDDKKIAKCIKLAHPP